MAQIAFNPNYVSTNRGIIKILQIIFGIAIASFLYTHWYNGSSTFSSFRTGFPSSLNSICLIINIVLFILGLLTIGSWKLERIYAIVGAVLFLIAVILVVWFIVEYNATQWKMLASVALLVGECILYVWDVKILQGESSN